MDAGMNRRAEDKGLAAAAAKTARSATKTLWDWTEKRKVAAHVVFGTTVWLSFRIVEWSLDLPFELVETKYTGVDVGAMQAAVLGPWGLMQGAMFKFYMDLIKSNGNGGGNV